MGGKITIQNGNLIVPNNPIIPFIEGDGIGKDISFPSHKVLDAAVKKSYGTKSIHLQKDGSHLTCMR